MTDEEWETFKNSDAWDGYNRDGTLNPRGLALWFDEEGGIYSFIQGRGISDLLAAGVDPNVARGLEEAMEIMEEELERIGATL